MKAIQHIAEDAMHDRYPLTFRAKIVRKLMTEISQGNCACVVGLAGVGKSNLVRFLQRRDVVHSYVTSKPMADRIHVFGVDCSSAAAQPPHLPSQDKLYRTMSTCVHNLAQRRGWALPAPDVQAGPYEILRSRLEAVCADQGQRLVFVLDEFEFLLRQQGSDVLPDLRRLRDDHRERANLLFIVVTHILPQLVAHNPPIRETKLFELLGEHIYPLPPYRQADADSMLDDRLHKKGADPDRLAPDTRTLLYNLSGGHSRLLRVIFDAYFPDFPQASLEPARLLQTQPAVRLACQHIWTHLHMDEQNFLLALAQQRSLKPAAAEYLERRGLLRRSFSGFDFFSPVFGEYVRSL